MADHRNVLDAWVGLLATADPHTGCFLELSSGWQRVLGWSSEELCAKPFVEFVHPDDRAATIAAAQTLARGGNIIHFTNRYACKDGTYKWILWTSSVDPEVPEHERVIYASAHEISEHVETQKKLERALAEADSFRRIAEATSDFIGMSSTDARVTYINQAGLKMLGQTAEEVDGVSVTTLCTPAYAERIGTEAIPHAIMHGVWNGEGELVHKDGSVIPVSQVVVPIRDASGELIALGTIIRDIREAKALEVKLRARQDQLAATLQAMSTPLIPITREIVVMPLIGQMDSARADQVVEAALDGVGRGGAQVVILDITGLAAVDTAVAAALIRAARALQLLGARTILTGIQPAVAQTLVGLGLDLGTITTHGTLQTAIATALRELGAGRA